MSCLVYSPDPTGGTATCPVTVQTRAGAGKSLAVGAVSELGSVPWVHGPQHPSWGVGRQMRGRVFGEPGGLTEPQFEMEALGPGPLVGVLGPRARSCWVLGTQAQPPAAPVATTSSPWAMPSACSPPGARFILGVPCLP